jgi:hypothetical protein
MPKQLSSHFSNQQLEQIIEEALIYMCACPAQVAEELLHLRKVFTYQKNCISEGSLLDDVHHRISDATQEAHAVMEKCLDDVLALEGWDLQTLRMPEGLRKLREEKVIRD